MNKQTTWETLESATEGSEMAVHIVDFENTNWPKDENPRWIVGEVVNVKEDVKRQAGEVVRVVTIGNPWEDGCHIDVIDTAQNTWITGPRGRKYLKAWRPRTGKDRLLLGVVDDVELRQTGENTTTAADESEV